MDSKSELRALYTCVRQAFPATPVRPQSLSEWRAAGLKPARAVWGAARPEAGGRSGLEAL